MSIPAATGEALVSQYAEGPATPAGNHPAGKWTSRGTSPTCLHRKGAENPRADTGRLIAAQGLAIRTVRYRTIARKVRARNPARGKVRGRIDSRKTRYGPQAGAKPRSRTKSRPDRPTKHPMPSTGRSPDKNQSGQSGVGERHVGPVSRKREDHPQAGSNLRGI
jgi:hypothetical protein